MAQEGSYRQCGKSQPASGVIEGCRYCIAHPALVSVSSIMGDTAAFFDMDHTITWENSGLSFVRYSRSKGLIDTGHLVKSMFKIVLYRLTLLNIDAWYEKSMEMLAGTKLQELEPFCAQWFAATLGRAIYKEAYDLIKDHRTKGHRIVIISNSPSFFVRPMADMLQIGDIICTQVEIREGALTGRLIKPLCYGEGKRHYAEIWSEENGIDLRKSSFYTDSYFDIALMKVIGFPYATNPDRKMRKAALKYRWPVLEFERVSAF